MQTKMTTCFLPSSMCAYILLSRREHTASDVKAHHNTQIADVIEAFLDGLLVVDRNVAKHDKEEDLLYL